MGSGRTSFVVPVGLAVPRPSRTAAPSAASPAARAVPAAGVRRSPARLARVPAISSPALGCPAAAAGAAKCSVNASAAPHRVADSAGASNARAPAPSSDGDALAAAGAVVSFSLVWDRWYALLAERVRQSEPGRFVRAAEPHAEQLLEFMYRCRRDAARGFLRADRVRKLDEVGFEWDESRATWRMRLDELVQWRKAHGTFVVPAAANPYLGQWSRRQRYLKGRGGLSADRVDMLAGVGFSFHPVRDQLWETRYSWLAEFHDEHGHADVAGVPPRSGSFALQVWLRSQRRLLRSGRLSADRSRRLSALGVTWEPRGEAWECMFRALAGYKERHGHCEVPQSPGLGRWVHRQRVLREAGSLAADRQIRLANIGFVWHQHEASWESKLLALQAYYARHPDLRGCVPPKGGEFKSLAQWLRNQRSLSRRGQLRQDRSAQLQNIGVVW
jgi:Helicase associated domain